MSTPGPSRHSPLGMVAVVAGLVVMLVLSGAVLPAGKSPPPTRSKADAPHALATARVPAAGSPAVIPQALTRSIPSNSNPRLSGPNPLIHRSGSVIDPTTFYSSEPAPMGIADFGVSGTGTSAQAYSYSTDSFVGTATVRSMTMSLNGGSAPIVAAFELNAMLELRWNGIVYTYWIQNGLHVNTGSREFTIGGAYVWNFSAPGATIRPSELRGNSSSVLASDTYYYIPACGTYLGQCSTLSWPSTFLGRIDAVEGAGTPEVEYEYNLGAGWVTYDTVSFVHLINAAVTGFVVDGATPTPYAPAAFYDAEWVWVGAGGGTTGRDQGSNLDMSLEFNNGHNLQAVPGAWNFGGDTGETSINVTEALASSSLDGRPQVSMTSGAGSLGPLYSPSGIAFLDVVTPATNGTLIVNGAPVGFTNHSLNLTLDPGNYAIDLENYSNASGVAELAPGQAYLLDLSGAGRTTFVQSGLPSATMWGLTVDGVAESTRGGALSFNLPNGSYAVSYVPVPGYLRSADPATVKVPTSGPIELVWIPFTYRVSVTEAGLPTSTAWWVDLGGTIYRSSTSILDLSAPNGSTPFVAGSVFEFVATPPNGTIVVSNGQSPGASVVFSYRPTFIAGTVTPANAALSVGGNPQPLHAGAFNVSVDPGVYPIVASATGYVSKTLDVNATPGNTTYLSIELSAGPTTPRAPSSPAGGGIGQLDLIALGVAAAIALTATVLLLRRRGPRSG